jgi:hypothetical protein
MEKIHRIEYETDEIKGENKDRSKPEYSVCF